MRSKRRIKAYLDNVKLASAGSGNDLVYEGYRELEERYLKNGTTRTYYKAKSCTRARGKLNAKG